MTDTPCLCSHCEHYLHLKQWEHQTILKLERLEQSVIRGEQPVDNQLLDYSAGLKDYLKNVRRAIKEHLDSPHINLDIRCS